MDHNRHLHIDLVLSLILLVPAKREGKRIKGKLASIIRKLYGVSSGRSIIFSPAWNFIRSSLKPKIKASHINLHQLAAHLPDTKQLLTLPKIQAARSQRHSASEATAAHYLMPNKLSRQTLSARWRNELAGSDNECPAQKRQPTSPSPE